MEFTLLFSVSFACFLLIKARNVSFESNYAVRWGDNHIIALNHGQEVQLLMDSSSGAGFESKLSYGSGFFNMRIKVPNKDSAGVVTAFYLTSNTSKHDEVDFEFLGNKEGKPITLQTNVFANGKGDREQRTLLWFDPTADFHSYKILWNQQQIVFYVDKIPIRVFKNNTRIGVSYPSQAVKVEVSLWNGDDWATDGGRTKVNWTEGPFKAYFQDFNINGCPYNEDCYSSNYWWNKRKFWTLDPTQKRQYKEVREKYMNYDYCTDKDRLHTSPECFH